VVVEQVQPAGECPTRSRCGTITLVRRSGREDLPRVIVAAAALQGRCPLLRTGPNTGGTVMGLARCAKSCWQRPTFQQRMRRSRRISVAAGMGFSRPGAHPEDIVNKLMLQWWHVNDPGVVCSSPTWDMRCPGDQQTPECWRIAECRHREVVAHHQGANIRASDADAQCW
jgi:hypothetical protein